ncbi:sigma-70 family RNA polymerase sigma factor [Chitinophaga sp. G-6-1-13]|uniref:Sigma-70 family RNA polymerase sigma factor n=1 Tax=Chitinophaga fulva TaxID=2728842 RepID=A0A848GNF4_9BACT|nr:sigma-70 family RNA polymerase sigma factor [Chitinophaga fulva]NML39944.1 sigma-70 family RNA polymerase sigma factor [Chitinophaga fulva]
MKRFDRQLEQDLKHIIAECRQGNRKAQEQLYRQLYGFAMAIAMRYANDEHEAGDILCHAFVKMFRSLHTFDESKGNFHGWLKKIVINEALDIVKQRSRFSSLELEAVEEPSVNNSVIEKTDAADILQLVRKLPPATHAVFVLYAIDGYTHKEIATQLNISEGTSKWHLSEARKILQQKLTATKV